MAILEDAVSADCDVRLQCKIAEGGVHINFRRSVSETGLSRYFFGINGTELYLGKQRGEDFADLVHKQVELDDDWHELEIRVCGGLINIYVDQALLIAYEDEAPLEAGGVAFETLEDSRVWIRALEITPAAASEMVAPSIEDTALRMEQQARLSFAPDETHEGDLVLDGSEELIIENESYLQLGNVYLNGSSRLVIRDSTFMLGRGDVPTVHVYINVAEHAELVIERSTVIEQSLPDGGTDRHPQQRRYENRGLSRGDPSARAVCGNGGDCGYRDDQRDRRASADRERQDACFGFHAWRARPNRSVGASADSPASARARISNTGTCETDSGGGL